MAIVYTLKEREDTGELHLFEATPSTPGHCTPRNTSICEAMNNSESIRVIFACKTEEEARKKCAEIGREVCGNCVKNLYATYED